MFPELFNYQYVSIYAASLLESICSIINTWSCGLRIELSACLNLSFPVTQRQLNATLNILAHALDLCSNSEIPLS
jgi:hypothetical protein